MWLSNTELESEFSRNYFGARAKHSADYRHQYQHYLKHVFLCNSNQVIASSETF